MTFKPESPKQEVMEHLCVWVGWGGGGGQRGGGGSVTGMFLTVSSPAAVSLEPCLTHSSPLPPHGFTMKPIQRNRKCPPVNWGPIKAIIIPVSQFLQEIAPQKICQLCRECAIIVSQVFCLCAVFFFFCVLLYQSLLTKGHRATRLQPRALHTVTAVQTRRCVLWLGFIVLYCEKPPTHNLPPSPSVPLPLPAVSAPASLVPILN